MKNKIILSIIIVSLGILIALTPVYIFPVCSGKMNCAFTGRSEIGIGAVIAVLGLIMIFFSEKVREGISIGIATIGILVILFPLKLTGVCGGGMMKCHMATQPMLMVLGTVTILISLINAVFLHRRYGK